MLGLGPRLAVDFHNKMHCFASLNVVWVCVPAMAVNFLSEKQKHFIKQTNKATNRPKEKLFKQKMRKSVYGNDKM